MSRPQSAESILRKARQERKQKYQPQTQIATEMFIPNHSGDHAAGIRLGTPTKDTDLVNKKYVDDNASGAPTGSILMFGGTSAPTGFLLCQGQAISRSTYSALFAIIGTTFGVGDGSTTFNIPDMRGIFPRGAGVNGQLTKANGDDLEGILGGYANDMIQGHYHTITDGTNFLAGVANSGGSFSKNIWYDTTSSTDWQATDMVADSDNGTPRYGDETRPANLSVNFIIKI